MAEYDDLDYDEGGDLVKQLRKQLKEMSAALKERDEMLEEYMTQTRTEQIGESLTEMGYNAKIASFVPDNGEDEDDLAAWLKEYGEVFGAQPAEQEQSTEEASTVDEAAALMSAVEEGGIDPTVGQSLEAKIQNASTPEELAAILKG